jgi:acetylornithine deacetylase
MPIDPLLLARRLIDIPSPSGSEGEYGRFLVPVMEQIGFSVTLQPLGPDRFNHLGIAGGGDPDIVFCTHIDVVPPHIPSREDDTWLYGRGACDTKGILAAMLAASERLIHDGAGGFALLLVVAEETDSTGARSANDWQRWRSRFVPGGGDGVVVGFNTDIPFLTRLGRPVLFGPGSILDAHSDGEKIRKNDLLAAVATYRDLVMELGAAAG